MNDLIGPPDPANFSLSAQIKEVEREIQMRIQVFGRRVSAGTMKRSDMEFRVNAMKAVLETLKKIAP